MINQGRNDRFRESLDPDLIKAAQENKKIPMYLHWMDFQPLQQTIDIEYEDVTDVKGFTDSEK